MFTTIRIAFFLLLSFVFQHNSLVAVEIIAHRGASADAPENTLASMKLAWEQNADAIELDLWLSKDGKLIVSKTPNGENPLVHGATPILGCDVWEHSYYIDYRNRRPDYLKAFLDHLVNWEHVEEMFVAATK